MKDDGFKPYKNAKFGEGFQKESARAEYEEYRKAQERDMVELSQGDLVEARIQKAMQDGAFENLKGKGEPMDLSEYFAAPEHLRMAYHFLKNSGFVPEEVRLRKEMEELKERLAAATTEEEKQELKKRIEKAAMEFGLHMDYNRSLAKKLY